ncbi:hypothetical protein BC826DRAFT_969259 [Russula brevipes]|nr:hypothetical protein BC826DRAFT_969259 [Russula brevipes]
MFSTPVLGCAINESLEEKSVLRISDEESHRLYLLGQAVHHLTADKLDRHSLHDQVIFACVSLQTQSDHLNDKTDHHYLEKVLGVSWSLRQRRLYSSHSQTSNQLIAPSSMTRPITPRKDNLNGVSDAPSINISDGYSTSDRLRSHDVVLQKSVEILGHAYTSVSCGDQAARLSLFGDVADSGYKPLFALPELQKGVRTSYLHSRVFTTAQYLRHNCYTGASSWANNATDARSHDAFGGLRKSGSLWEVLNDIADISTAAAGYSSEQRNGCAHLLAMWAHSGLRRYTKALTKATRGKRQGVREGRMLDVDGYTTGSRQFNREVEACYFLYSRDMTPEHGTRTANTSARAQRRKVTCGAVRLRLRQCPANVTKISQEAIGNDIDAARPSKTSVHIVRTLVPFA